jgi:16S rRNA processing protein RimM
LTVERSPSPGGLLAIGRVARAHGLKGELRVEPFFDQSDALAEIEELWLSRDANAPVDATKHAVEFARPVPKAYLVKLEGVSDRNASEALRGATVWVERGALPETDDSEYYLVDLIGAKVVGPEGDVGVVVAIATHPSVDAIVIELPDGKRVEQPLVDDWVARVSVAEKLIELSSLEAMM